MDDALAEVWSGRDWIDVSRPLSVETPVWPGDRPLEITSRRVDGLMVSAVASTCHVGTHLDAPLHLDPTGVAAHEVPVGRLVGPAEVVRLPAGCGAAGVRDLPLGWEPRDPKVLLRTDSHPVGVPFTEGFAATSAELVTWLAEHGVSTIGIDTPSFDEFASVDLEAHRALADLGLTWIEGLDLDGVEAGRYLLVALPLPLRGTEAAPVRALLKKIPSSSL